MERFSQPKQNLEMFEPAMLGRLNAKANQVNRESSLNMEPFIDLYGMETVKRDYSEIAGKILSFDTKPEGAESIGHVFEAAFLDIGSRGQWFGENSELVRASKYDDINNGVDMIATTLTPDNSARHLAVASDLTFSFPRASEKLNRIVSQTYAGKLAEIKYFHSDLLHFTGKQSNVPRTVIGLEAQNLNRLFINWLREPELAQLQYGSIIMQQIAAQCEALSFVAGSKQPNARDAYRKVTDLAHILLRTSYKNIEAPEDKILSSIQKHSDRLMTEFK